ncbi:uncharacterized protein LOC115874454 [Sitophilus oryzae]|uniref:Uncharacterized protein LOC115874454 n=1 Tax=Sitophilus oryzae TaxID=7048 RepID=A0A6J2X2P0_SITOR|nr:uncharacterized protein LOC115874454 [Sitophilus oryzae]
MYDAKELHSRFLKEVAESSKLLPSLSCTALPSFLFLFSVFLLLYFRFHQYETYFAAWYSKLYKALLFHWTYFYTTRVWFIFLKICKWIIENGDHLFTNESNSYTKMHKNLVTCVMFLIVLGISLIPCIVLTIKCFDRTIIPNFLMMGGAEDPWMRSEIGTAGHYLERPPRAGMFSYKKQNVSYRSKRSTSVDTDIYMPRQPFVFRSSRSLQNINNEQ